MTQKEGKSSRINRSHLRKSLSITWTVTKWAIALLIVCGFFGGSVAFGYVTSLVKEDPIRSRQYIMEKMQDNVQTGFIYFRDGTRVGQLRTEEDRRLAELDEIPKLLQDSFLAIEDNDFYNHIGVDVKGLFRAVKQQVLQEDVQTGGSTITQQLARRVFLNLDRSSSRKAKELFLSVRLERILSKDEIFLAYLNKVPFGTGASGYPVYGIKAAAKGIFNVDDLSELNVAQSAYLAGLVQLPSNYSAFNGKGEFDSSGFKRATTRQQLVLKRMFEEGVINQQQYDEALAFNLKDTLAKTQKKAYTTYPYLMIEVEKAAGEILLKQMRPDAAELKPAQYNEALKEAQEMLQHGGYHVYTTIDKPIYDELRAFASDSKNFTPDDPTKGVEQIGAIMIENRTGAIISMIEGRDFYLEQMNHATQALRQPGSTMKPIAAFLPAIEKGTIQPASIIDDVPIILKDGVKGFHLPENWDGKFHGLITARRAFNQSYNIPALKIFLFDVGISEAWEFSRKLGITTLTKEDEYAQTGVIGGLTQGTSVKELTGAYASIPNRGVFNEPYLIQEIKDPNGKTIYQHEAKPRQVYSEETAYLMTDMMRTVITAGTATDLMSSFKNYKNVQIAGKTGSTQEDADAWFMGFTPDVTVGVWAGYESPKHTLSKRGCNWPAGCGTQRAKKVWSMAMDTAINLAPDLFQNKSFEKPDNIVEMTVSSVSGKLPSELITESGKLTTDIFNKAFIPTEEDQTMVMKKYVTYEQKNYVPNPATPVDMIQEAIVIERSESIAALIEQIEPLLEKLPDNRKQTIDHYYPIDYENDAPVLPDPRIDDGQSPDSPTNITVSSVGDTAVITFEPAGNEDIAGYRLYRSVHHGPFQRAGKTVLTGQPPKLEDTITAGNIYGYYMTAVDVAGRESSPSQAVYTDGSRMNIFHSPNPGGDNSDDSDGILFGDPSLIGGGNSGSGGIRPRPTPTPSPLPAPKQVPSAPAGVSIKQNHIGIEIRWNANSDKDVVSQYEVQYSEKENGPYSKLHTTETTSMNYYAMSYDGWYRVVATNAKGTSKPSKAVKFQYKQE
jgi:penicillin-binding protein 1B